jgi:hypothetical protein
MPLSGIHESRAYTVTSMEPELIQSGDAIERRADRMGAEDGSVAL